MQNSKLKIKFSSKNAKIEFQPHDFSKMPTPQYFPAFYPKNAAFHLKKCAIPVFNTLICTLF
jgi:hypothetical protein